MGVDCGCVDYNRWVGGFRIYLAVQRTCSDWSEGSEEVAVKLDL